jgi:quercetin dioxygenase-like cupin family protein
MGQEAMVDPPGEKFALVLSGVMETRVGDQVYTLEPGCTIYFPSNLPHNWRAVGEETLVVVVVVYPPWF